MSYKKGILFVLSSPSGAGKTTICKKILALDKNLKMSISYTTRPKRKSEIDGKDYYFISNDEFLRKKNNNEFIETAIVFEHNYGTPKKFLDDNINNGYDVMFDIDESTKQALTSQYNDETNYQIRETTNGNGQTIRSRSIEQVEGIVESEAYGSIASDLTLKREDNETFIM